MSAPLAAMLDYLRALGWEELYLPAGTSLTGRAATSAAASGHVAPQRDGGDATGRRRSLSSGAGVQVAVDAQGASVAEPAASADERAAELVRVASEALACTRCKLALGRRTVVFGSGNPDADLMFIGEGPGAEEDRQGLPFVGPAGQLLTKIIGAIGLGREQVYICNVVKCRPPGNRDPQPDEVAACRSYLEAQVRLVRPRVIVALGRVAAQTLLGNDLPVGRLRGSWHQMLGVPLRVTYHPAALLRDGGLKRPTWDDMQVVRDRLALPVTG